MRSHTHTPIHTQEISMKLVKIILMSTLGVVVLCLGFVMVSGIRTAAAKTTMSDDAAEQIEKVITGTISRGSASGQGSVSHDITGSDSDKDVAPGAVGTIPHPPPPPPYQSPTLRESPSIAVVAGETQLAEDTGTRSNQYSLETGVEKSGKVKNTKNLGSKWIEVIKKKVFTAPMENTRGSDGKVPILVDDYEEKHLKTVKRKNIITPEDGELEQTRVLESPSPGDTVRETEERPDSQQKPPSPGDTVQETVERQDSQQKLPSPEDNVDKQLEELTQQQQKKQEENNSPGE